MRSKDIFGQICAACAYQKIHHEKLQANEQLTILIDSVRADHCRNTLMCACHRPAVGERADLKGALVCAAAVPHFTHPVGGRPVHGYQHANT